MRNVARHVAVAVFTLVVAGTAHATCPTGTTPCGANFCSPAGDTCCASVGHPEVSCPNGEACNTDGTCDTTSGGGTFSCESQQMPEYNGCTEGVGQCGCADPCSIGTDCTSGCCSNGYCAFSCVCSGQGFVSHANTSVFKNECSASYTGGGQSGGGCSTAPRNTHDSNNLPLALVVSGLALVMRRIRRSQLS
jgi:hypothetical protein